RADRDEPATDAARLGGFAGISHGLSVLNNRHDVAFAVLEPRRLRAAGGEDSARALFAGHVVVLEYDTARFQLGDLALAVVDLPERLACSRRACVVRRVEEACRLVAELVDDAACYLKLWPEAELAFVEL